MGDCVNFRRLFGDDDGAQARANRLINRQLRRERARYQSIIRLLLLGAGESGKSTIVKQMKILHVDGYTDQERREMVVPIRRNLRDAILAIVGAMSIITPPEPLGKEEEAWRVKYLLEVGSHLDGELPPEFYEHCAVLWRDAGVQRTYARSNEYHLIDSARYFLDQTEAIGADDFLPTDQDMLRCRILTCGIFETHFSVDDVNFHMFDVGGQRSERRRWIQCFNDVTAIIFVAACSAYDLRLLEDPTQNRLREALELFESVWTNRWLERISIVLFLNKEDLLQEKIASGKSRLEDYFPDFAEFHTQQNGSSKSSSESELDRAKYFIQSLFVSISTAKSQRNRLCYPHYTCAVDTERMRIVFRDCKDIIQRKIIATIVAV